MTLLFMFTTGRMVCARPALVDRRGLGSFAGEAVSCEDREDREDPPPS